MRTAPKYQKKFDITNILFQFFAFTAFVLLFPSIVFTSVYGVISQNSEILELNLYLIFIDAAMAYIALVLSSIIDCKYMVRKKRFLLTRGNLRIFVKFFVLLLLLFLSIFAYI